MSIRTQGGSNNGLGLSLGEVKETSKDENDKTGRESQEHLAESMHPFTHARTHARMRLPQYTC